MNHKSLLMVALLSVSLTACQLQKVEPPDVVYRGVPEGIGTLTIGVANPPEGLVVDKVNAVYSIVNRGCVPIDETMAIGGRRPHFREEISLDISRIGDNAYETSVALRPIESADYFGLGTCHWKLEGISIIIHTTRQITAAVSRQQLNNNAEVSLCCPRNTNNASGAGVCLLDSAVSNQDPKSYFNIKISYLKE